MTATELRAAITGPAGMAKLDLEDGLVELLVRDIAPIGADPAGAAHDAGALPLLSHALLATWERSQRGRLTVADYRACGAIDGAVARTADETFDQLTDTQQALARTLFLRMVNIAEDGTDTRRRMPRTEPLARYGDIAGDDDVEHVLDLFVQRRLLTTDAETVEITHEALIRAWPLLRKWIDADRAGLRAAQLLREAAVAWQREQRDPAALYGGTRLAAVRDWIDAGHGDELSPLAREFLHASIGRERRRSRLIRSVVAGLAGLSLVAGTTTVVAMQQRGVAQRARATASHERNLALSRLVAGRADRVRDNDAALSMQLSLAAYRMAPTVEARSSLLDSSATPAVTRLLGITGTVHSVAFSPDMRIMAAGGADATVRLWDVHDPHRPAPLGAPLAASVGRVTTVAFSPDGRTLAAAGSDSAVRLWDLARPHQPRPLEPGPTPAGGLVNSVAFSADGSVLAAGGADTQVHLWRVASNGQLGQLQPLTASAEINSVRFSPDGHTLAVGTDDGTVSLWDTTDPARPVPRGTPLTVPTGTVNTLVFSPDGRTLAAGGMGRVIHLWNTTDPNRSTPTGPPLTGPASWVYSIAFSPDGLSIAAGSADNAARIWDLATHRATATLPHPSPVTAVAYRQNSLATGAADGVTRLWTLPTPVLTQPTGSVFTVAYSPDGKALAAASGDKAARLWDITDPWHPAIVGPPLTAELGSASLVGSLAFGPGGRLAAGRDDGTVQLWDASNIHRPVPGPPASGLTGVIESVTFSPDGSLLAAGSETGGVHIWDVSDPRQPRQLAQLATTHANNAFSVAFSPDGRILAAASADRTVWLWDVTDPRRPTVLAPPLTGPTGAVYHVAFHPDGRFLAAGSADGTVRLWDLGEPRRPTAIGTPLTGPKGYVYAVALSPDGRTLATASSDKTVWMWDLTDPGSPGSIAVLGGPGGTVYSVAYDPNGRTVASGSQDHTVRLWHIDPDDVAARACAVAGDPLTTAEWRQYIPDVAYRPVCAT